MRAATHPAMIHFADDADPIPIANLSAAGRIMIRISILTFSGVSKDVGTKVLKILFLFSHTAFASPSLFSQLLRGSM